MNVGDAAAISGLKLREWNGQRSLQTALLSLVEINPVAGASKLWNYGLYEILGQFKGVKPGIFFFIVAKGRKCQTTGVAVAGSE